MASSKTVQHSFSDTRVAEQGRGSAVADMLLARLVDQHRGLMEDPPETLPPNYFLSQVVVEKNSDSAQASLKDLAAEEASATLEIFLIYLAPDMSSLQGSAAAETTAPNKGRGTPGVNKAPRSAKELMAIFPELLEIAATDTEHADMAATAARLLALPALEQHLLPLVAHVVRYPNDIAFQHQVIGTLTGFINDPALPPAHRRLVAATLDALQDEDFRRDLALRVATVPQLTPRISFASAAVPDKIFNSESIQSQINIRIAPAMQDEALQTSDNAAAPHVLSHAFPFPLPVHYAIPRLNQSARPKPLALSVSVPHIATSDTATQIIPVVTENADIADTNVAALQDFVRDYRPSPAAQGMPAGLTLIPNDPEISADLSQFAAIDERPLTKEEFAQHRPLSSVDMALQLFQNNIDETLDTKQAAAVNDNQLSPSMAAPKPSASFFAAVGGDEAAAYAIATGSSDN